MALSLTSTELPISTTSAMLPMNNSNISLNESCGGNTTQQSTASPTSAMTMPLADVVIVVFYGVICAVGLLGNALVISVILRYSSMKTATNVYLVNLSMADLLFLIGLPLIITTAIMRGWIFGHTMCKVFYVLTCANTFNGSLTLAILSGDRYLAVCHPIDSRRYRTPTCAAVVVVISWVLSAVAIYPVAKFAVSLPQRPNSCHMDWPDGYVLYIVYTFVLGFMAPVALICVFYAFLVARLANVRRRASSYASASGSGASSRANRSQRRVTRMVTVVVAVYIVCWLPYWTFQLFIVLSGVSTLPYLLIVLFKALTALSYANSMINPLLYAFTNEQFRKLFLKAFCCDSTDAPSPGASVYNRSGVTNRIRGGGSHAIRDDDETDFPQSSVMTSMSPRSADVSMQRLISTNSSSQAATDGATEEKDEQEPIIPSSSRFLSPDRALNGHNNHCKFRLSPPS